MLHRNEDGTFCISSHDVWLPGAYADEKTAMAAFKFPDEVLQRLQDAAIERGGNRSITAEDLAAARQAQRG